MCTDHTDCEVYRGVESPGDEGASLLVASFAPCGRSNSSPLHTEHLELALTMLCMPLHHKEAHSRWDVLNTSRENRVINIQLSMRTPHNVAIKQHGLLRCITFGRI